MGWTSEGGCASCQVQGNKTCNCTASCYGLEYFGTETLHVWKNPPRSENRDMEAYTQAVVKTWTCSEQDAESSIAKQRTRLLIEKLLRTPNNPKVLLQLRGSAISRSRGYHDDGMKSFSLSVSPKLHFRKAKKAKKKP